MQKRISIFIIILLILGGAVGIWATVRSGGAPPSFATVDEIAGGLRVGDERYAQELSEDRVGAETPRETLKAFILAVEQGDDRRAAQYFVLEKQEEWRRTLATIRDNHKIADFIVPLKQALEREGVTSPDGTFHSLDSPVSVEFRRGPGGIWKIVEI